MNGRTVLEMDSWWDDDEEDDAIYFTEEYQNYYTPREGQTHVTDTSTNGGTVDNEQKGDTD